MRLLYLTLMAVGVISGCSETSTSAANASAQPAEKAALASNVKDATNLSDAKRGTGTPLPIPATATGRGDRPVVPRTQLEATLVRGDSIEVSRVQSLLTAQDFDKSLRQFAREAGSSTEAQDLTSLYKRLIAKQLGNSAELVTFACGETLCLGSIRTQTSNQAYTRWGDGFFQAPETPNYVFTDNSVSLGGGVTENRFMFSTDPAVNSASMPR